MSLNQQFLSKVKCGMVTQQLECASGFFKQFFIIVEYNCDASDPTTIAIIVFIIRIGDELNINLIALLIDIPNRITSNCTWYLIYRMTAGILVYDIFYVMVFVMDIMIKRLTLSFLHTLCFIFDGIISHSDKQIAIEWFSGNNSFCEIGDAAIVLTAFLTVIYFVMQVMDRYSLDMILSVDFDASIIAFAQLILYSTPCLMTSAIYFNQQVTRNVSYVISLSFFCIVWRL